MLRNKLSIIIPCKNEEENVTNTINLLSSNLSDIDHEIVIINDFSTDKTTDLLISLSKRNKKVKTYNNSQPGLGSAIQLAFDKCSGEFVAIVMADLSDDPKDLVSYYNLINNQDLDGVFGSRFIEGSIVKNYPKKKLILNRLFNCFVKLILFSNYNDFTNAFKIYRIDKIKMLQPFVSKNFNIFLEIPLKFILSKFKYKIIPINWYNRKKGKTKFKIKELSSNYIFTLFYCFFKKLY